MHACFEEGSLVNVLALALPLALAAAPSGTPSTPEAFDALKAKSKEVDSLAKALAAIVGDCGDVEDFGNKIDCRENMKKAKKEWRGKRVYVYLGAAERGAMKFEGERGDGVRVIWFPIYDAGRNLALTVGKPTKVNSRGNLTIRPTLIDGKLPSSVFTKDMARLIRTQNVAIEVIGTFGRPWKKSGKGRTYKGVEFNLEAVRLIHARNGKTLVVSKF